MCLHGYYTSVLLAVWNANECKRSTTAVPHVSHCSCSSHYNTWLQFLLVMVTERSWGMCHATLPPDFPAEMLRMQAFNQGQESMRPLGTRHSQNSIQLRLTQPSQDTSSRASPCSLAKAQPADKQLWLCFSFVAPMSFGSLRKRKAWFIETLPFSLRQGF